MDASTTQRLTEVFPGMRELPGRVAARTLEGYRSDAQQYLAWCTWDPARALNPHTLRAWLQHQVAAGLSANTINRRRACILTLIRLSVACEALDERLAYRFGLVAPVKLAPLRARLREHQPLTPKQVRDLCMQPDPRQLIGLRDRSLLLLMASSGCRLHEVIGLQQTHLVASGSLWRVSFLGKGQAKPRQAPLSTEAYTWLHRWLRARAATGIDVPWVCTGVTPHHRPLPKPLTVAMVWNRVKKYGQQIGLPRVAPHDLRRFVAQQVTARYDLRTAQQVLGHAKIETTILYLTNEMPDGTTEGLF
jgi:site-specific recombinase XerD